MEDGIVGWLRDLEERVRVIEEAILSAGEPEHREVPTQGPQGPHEGFKR